MALPQFATYINPLIAALKKLGGSARANEACNTVAEDLSLPDSVLEEQLKNGVSRFENQVHWARFYLRVIRVRAWSEGHFSILDK